MAEGQIVVELILDDGQIIKALGRVKQEAEDTKKTLESDSGGGFLSKKLGDISVGMAAVGVAAVKAFDVLKHGFTEAVAASRESQKAIDDLSTALAVNGKYSEQAVAGFEKFSSALSQQTGINDDVITQNASLLVSLGHLSGEGLQNATKAAVDLAAATGKDLGTAFQLVSKAAEGNVEMLKRYGITVDEHLPKNEKFAQALQKINDKFGGLAAARADTFEGSLNKLTNAMDDLFKAFGNIIVKSPVARELIKLVGDVIKEFASSVEKATKGKDLFGDFIKAAIPVARGINDYLIKPIEIFGRAVVTGISTVATVFLGLNAIFLRVSQLFFEYIEKPIAMFFGDKLGSFVGLFDEEMGGKLKASFQSVGDSMSQTAEQAAAGASDLFQTSLGQTLAAADSTFETTGSQAIDALLLRGEQAAAIALETTTTIKNNSAATQQEMIDTSTTLGESFGFVLDGMDSAAKDFAAKGADNFRKIGQSMFQSVGQAAGQAFAAFGKAMASGQNALQAFINSLISAMGQMAIQLGTQFILQGIAYSWAGMPNGPPLIAAGIALAALGGVMSAIGGGGGGNPAAGAGGGSGAVSSADNPSVSLAAPPPPRSEASVIVNINGDVMDSTETGSRIVALIREHADRNGDGATAI